MYSLTEYLTAEPPSPTNGNGKGNENRKAVYVIHLLKCEGEGQTTFGVRMRSKN